MEKESITIEIKQEVSITLLWIVAGVVLISAAYFLTPVSTDLWPATNAAGIAAFLYLVALLFYVIRKPVATRWRVILSLGAILFLGCTTYRWVQMQDQVSWQANQLLRIRGVIGRGIRMTEMSGPLLKTLDAYHHQGSAKKNTLAEVFKKLYPAAAPGANIYPPKWEGDDMKIIVTRLHPDSIALVSQETIIMGRDSMFKNLDGKIGLAQEQYILTAKGLTHVSEN